MVKWTLRLTAPAVMLLLAMAGAFSAAAQTVEEAVAAYDRGDYATAYRGFQSAAGQGHSGAQHILGVMYNNGKGVPRDHAEAVRWYRRAAGQGNARAQNNLGLMYYNGWSGPLGSDSFMRRF